MTKTVCSHVPHAHHPHIPIVRSALCGTKTKTSVKHKRKYNKNEMA